MSLGKGLLVALCAGIGFAVFFELNSLLFSFFEFSRGVNWIFLPSGLRLVFILIFGGWGALGIVLGSIAMGYQQYYSGDVVNAVMAGLISGLSPLIARKFCADFLHLNTNLEGLTASTLIRVAAVFALFSSVLHQVWYVVHGQTQDFLTTTAVMGLGDFTGTVVVLYCARFVFKLWRSRAF